jgi:fido (protein-threonine AMPylation protein)
MVNNKLTKEEINEFLLQSNHIEREYSQEAFEDAKKAWKWAEDEIKKKKGVIDISFILGIHERLAKNIRPDIAGRIREVPVYIGNECRNQSYDEIVAELKELCGWWNSNKDILKSKLKRKQDREEFTKRWHAKYEFCHNFVDFNGRTGRILWNIQRLYLGLKLLIIHVGKEQFEYYKMFDKHTFLWNHQKEKIKKEYKDGRGKFIGELAREMNIYPQVIAHFLQRSKIKITKRNNSPKGEKSGRWKGGIRHVKGYRHFQKPGHNLARGDGWVPEHRYIMQEKLGRKLLKNEVVHHKDGNKTNNNINNLELFENNKEHKSAEIKNFPRNRYGQFGKGIKYTSMKCIVCNKEIKVRHDTKYCEKCRLEIEMGRDRQRNRNR